MNSTSDDKQSAKRASPETTGDTPLAPSALYSLPPVVHMTFLDGLRGLTALYVVFSHLRVDRLPSWANISLQGLYYGHVAVGVFIVLSGYCLMLPVARSAEGHLKGGPGEYFKRRAWRILPPYYAALLLGLPLQWLHEHNHRYATDWGALISHLLLVHNFSAAWNMAGNAAMWSVATEWQIYFFLPFVLLPVWRRGGAASAVAVGFLLGYLPHLVFPAGHNLDWACPWYLGLFALGMAGAALAFPRNEREKRFVERTPWGWLAATASLGVIVAHWFLHAGGDDDAFALDPLVGLSAICLIVFCARSPKSSARKPIILRLLETRFAVGIGAFSYSLYLTHGLLIMSCGWLLKKRFTTPLAIQFAEYVILVPLILGCAYLFYLVVERPSLNVRSRRRTQGQN